MLKSLLKKLPNKHKYFLKNIYEKIDIKIATTLSRYGITSSIYYLLINKSFWREHKAVLTGRIEYHKKLKEDGNTRALLRRNTHRLEKGLIMRPRKKIFAESYILETVECYFNNLQSEISSKEEQKWARDVLTEYFNNVDESELIKIAKEKFLSTKPSNDKENKFIPYKHKETPECSISYPQITQLFTRRRSTRWYLEKEVPIEKIQKAVQAASLAPSACNRQPYSFYISDTKEKAVDIAECAMGTAGFSKNIQCIVAIIGDLSAYPAERDRHVIYIDGSLAAMQFMLACETLGLATCPINWPDIESREKLISNKLQLKYYERPIMLISVGYPDPNGGIPFSQKKAYSETIKNF